MFIHEENIRFFSGSVSVDIQSLKEQASKTPKIDSKIEKSTINFQTNSYVVSFFT